MSLRDILLWPDPRLSQVCAPATGDLAGLVADMFETMYAAPGRGLAAPQVGVMQRVFVMDELWKQGTPTPIAFINPEIIWASDETTTAPEGCLSIPAVLADVTRPARVKMRWFDIVGKERTKEFSGFAAACVQHELDHLNGIVTFDRLSADARQAAEADYA